MQNQYWKRQNTKWSSARPIYKILPFTQDSFIFNRPDDKKLLIYNHNLEEILEINTSLKPQGLAVHKGEIFAGCHDGTIIRIDESKNTIKIESNNQNTYVNDIIVDDNSIINCYNNGNIRIWDRQTLKQRKTMKVHTSYTYKLRRRQDILFSCSHDQKIAVTDLERCEQIRYLMHPGSVWGIYASSQREVASVGLFGLGNIWDIRSGKCIQNWNLENDESSFITMINDRDFVMGDAEIVKTYDRRMGRIVTRGSLERSVEAILPVKNNKLIMAGRGGDLVVFKTDELLNKDMRPTNMPGFRRPLNFLFNFQQLLRPVITVEQFEQFQRETAHIQPDEDDIIIDEPEYDDEMQYVDQPEEVMELHRQLGIEDIEDLQAEMEDFAHDYDNEDYHEDYHEDFL